MSVDLQAPAPGIVHPEWVDGRRLWVDGSMRDLIDRLHNGDPVLGWEGDPRLAVYWNQPTQRWELWRLEDDNEYRFVCRSAPGVPFDVRVIHALIEWDVRRRQVSLHDEIVEHNDRLDAEADKRRNEWIAEEFAPKLRHALRKDAGW